MKKRLVMKKWVEVVLLVILFVMMFIVMSECDNTMVFAISHILGGAIIIVIAMMFMSFGRRGE